MRNLWMWKRRADFPEPRADRLYWKLSPARDRSRGQKSDESPRNGPAHFGPDDNYQKREDGDSDGLQRKSPGTGDIERYAVHKIGRDWAHAETEEVLNLTGHDDECDSACESRDHWMRNELHHTAESRDPHHDENDSRHECRDN